MTGPLTDKERRKAVDDRAALRAARSSNAFFREQNDVLKRALAAARAELDNQRAAAATSSGSSWYVARGPGRMCGRCDGPIERGQAVEIMPGSPADQHVHCPDPTA